MTSVGQQGANTYPRLHKHTGNSTRVLAYLRQNPNLAIPYEEITKVVGFEKAYQVPNAVQHLRAIGFPIEKPMQGVALYREIAHEKVTDLPAENVTGPLEPGREIFEQVGLSRGHVIVRGENNELYRLAPLADLWQ